MNKSLKILKGEVNARLDHLIEIKKTSTDEAVMDELERLACRIDQLILADLDRVKVMPKVGKSNTIRFGTIIVTDQPIYQAVRFKEFKELLLKHRPKEIFSMMDSVNTPIFVIDRIDEETITYWCPYWSQNNQKTVTLHALWLSWLSHDLQNLFIKLENEKDTSNNAGMLAGSTDNGTNHI
jgi:hypothetical protein